MYPPICIHTIFGSHYYVPPYYCPNCNARNYMTRAQQEVLLVVIIDAARSHHVYDEAVGHVLRFEVHVGGTSTFWPTHF